MRAPIYNKLYRSRTERKIGGVCGGLAEFYCVQPILMRLIAILFIFMGGAAVLAYLTLWLIIPLKPESGLSTEVITKKPSKLSSR